MLLPVFPFVYLSTYLLTHIYLSILSCFSFFLYVYISVEITIYLSIYSIYLYLSIYLSLTSWPSRTRPVGRGHSTLSGAQVSLQVSRSGRLRWTSFTSLTQVSLTQRHPHGLPGLHEEGIWVVKERRNEKRRGEVRMAREVEGI